MTASRWKYFPVEELTCKCGCGRADMEGVFMARMVALREHMGKGLVPTSAFRCPAHNAAVSKTKSRTGPHTTGRAMDVRASGDDLYKMFPILKELGFTGIGLPMSTYIHLDDLPNDVALGRRRPYVWGYT